MCFALQAAAKLAKAQLGPLVRPARQKANAEWATGQYNTIYRALFNTFLLIWMPFWLIYCVFNIRYLIFYVKLIFVATLVQYVWFSSYIFFWMFCIVFWVSVWSVGALCIVLGLCIVCRGFVYSFGGVPTPIYPPPPPSPLQASRMGWQKPSSRWQDRVTRAPHQEHDKLISCIDSFASLRWSYKTTASKWSVTEVICFAQMCIYVPIQREASKYTSINMSMHICIYWLLKPPPHTK